MSKLRYISVVALVLLLAAGCSEERKREAVRLAAELEAKERGETLVSDTNPSTSLLTEDSTATVSDNGTGDSEYTHDTATTPDLAHESQIALEDSLSALREPDTTVPKLQQPVRQMPPIVSDGYTVQVESSPVKTYIEQQVEVFKQRGYDAYLSAITRPDDQKTYYRLRVGRFATPQEAEALSQELNKTFSVGSWVDKTTLGPATSSGEHPR